MSGTRYAGAVKAVKLSRARLSRFFARVAVGSAVGPIALAMIAALLDTLGIRSFEKIVLEAWLLGWLVGTPVGTIAALFAGARRHKHADGVEADADGLRFSAGDTVHTIPRKRLAGGLYVASGEHEAEIVLANGDVLHVEVETAEAARALISALGFGAMERRTVVQLGTAHDALAVGCGSLILGVLVSTLSTCGMAAISSSFFNQFAGYILGFVFVATTLVASRILSPKRVIVGNDGVVLQGAFRDRFVPLASITGVDVTTSGLALVVKHGGATRHVTLAADKGQRAFALRERVLEAVAAAQRAGAETTSALVARGGRSLGEWREALRKLVAGGGYRGESVSLDALLRAVESAETPADQRIGAAMAISLADDAAAKQRLRIAVDGIANDRMRVAMEAAADGEAEEEAIAEVLAAEEKAAGRG